MDLMSGGQGLSTKPRNLIRPAAWKKGAAWVWAGQVASAS